MRCPKCGYTSFDHNETCPKCKRSVAAVRDQLGLFKFAPQPTVFLEALLASLDAPEEEPAAAEPEAASLDSFQYEKEGEEEPREITLGEDLEEVRLTAEEKEGKPVEEPGGIEFSFPEEEPVSVAEPVEIEGPVLEQEPVEIEGPELTLETEEAQGPELEAALEPAEEPALELALEEEEEEEPALEVSLEEAAPEVQIDTLASIEEIAPEEVEPILELAGEDTMELRPGEAEPVAEGKGPLGTEETIELAGQPEQEAAIDLGDLDLEEPPVAPLAQPAVKDRVLTGGLDPNSTMIIESAEGAPPAAEPADLELDLDLDSDLTQQAQSDELDLDLSLMENEPPGGQSDAELENLELDLDDLSLDDAGQPPAKP
ncbi:MAG: hypothetical protein AB1641_18265 [Thermodesulfobacteriota bacterium]